MAIPKGTGDSQVYIPQTKKTVTRKKSTSSKTDAQRALAERLALARRQQEAAERKRQAERTAQIQNRIADVRPKLDPTAFPEPTAAQTKVTLDEAKAHPDSGVQAPRIQKSQYFERVMQKAATAQQQQIAADVARATELRRLQEVEESATWISAAPMAVRRAEWRGSLGQAPPPTLATVLSRDPKTGKPVFDVSNTAHVTWVQRELRRQGASTMPVTGVFDVQTVDSLYEVMRKQKQERLNEEVGFIQDQLIGRGYLKHDMGLSPREIAEGAMRGEFVATQLYNKAVRDWLQRERSFTLEDMQDDWIRQRFFVSPFVDVSKLRWMVQLPPAFEGVDGLELDKALYAYKVQQQRAARLNAQARLDAATDTGFWRAGGLAMGVLDALAKPAQWTVNTVRMLDEMTRDDPWALLPFASSRFGREYWDERWRSMQPYEDFRTAHPKAAFVEEMLLDPFNFFTAGTVGSMGRVGRALLRGERVGQMGLVGLSVSDPVLRAATLRTMAATGLVPDAGAVRRAADTALSGVIRGADTLEELRPVQKAVGKVFAPVGRGTVAGVHLLGSFVDNVHNSDNALYNRLLRVSEIARSSVEHVLGYVRETRFEWVRGGFGVSFTRAGETEGLAELRMVDLVMKNGTPSYPGEDMTTQLDYLTEFWQSLPSEAAEKLAKDLYDTEAAIFGALAAGAPEMMRFVDRLGSRIYTDEGVLTRAGERLQAQMHRRAWLQAEAEMIRAGHAKPEDFSGAYTGAINPDIIFTFREMYLNPRYQFVDNVLMPVFEGHAFKKGYGFPTGAEASDRGAELVLDALKETVEVRNPNWVYTRTYDKRGTGHMYNEIDGAINDLHGSMQDSLGELRETERLIKAAKADPDFDRSELRSLYRQRNFYRRMASEALANTKYLRKLTNMLNKGSVSVDSFFGALDEMDNVMDEIIVSRADRVRRVMEFNRKFAAFKPMLDEHRGLAPNMKWVKRRGKWHLEEVEEAAPTGTLANAMNTILYPEAYSREAKEMVDEFLGELVEDLKKEAGAWHRRSIQQASPKPIGDTAGAATAQYAQSLLEQARRLEELLDEKGGYKFAGEEKIVWDYEAELGQALDIREVQRKIRHMAESGGDWIPVEPRRLSPSQYNEVVSWEITRRHGIRQTEWATRHALGQATPNDAQRAQILRKIELDVKKRYVAAGDGTYVDTAPKLSVPKLYVDDLSPEDVFGNTAHSIHPETGEVVTEWEQFGLGFDDLQASEFDALLTGTAMTETATGQLMVNRRSLLPWRVFAADRAELGGEWASPALRAARRIEQDLIGRAGERPPGGFGELPEALAARRKVLAKAEVAANGFLYKKMGLYLHLMAEHENKYLRGAFLGFRAITAGWRDAVLPLRFAWVVRNNADNFLKTVLAGFRDPRLFFDYNGRSVFDVVGLMRLRRAIALCDQVAGTGALRHFDRVLNALPDIGKVPMGKLLGLEDIGVLPPEVVGGNFTQSVRDLIVKPGETLADAAMRTAADQAGETFVHRGAAMALNGIDSVRNGYWSMMGDTPEVFWRKALYRYAFTKSLSNGYDHGQAERLAVAAVNKSLFDYSDPTVFEYNMKAIFPFYTFWSKNIPYWMERLGPQQAVQKPWMWSKYSIYSDYRDSDESKPEWMKRYLSVDGIGNLLSNYSWWGSSVVQPVGDFMAKAFTEAGYDPMNMTSVGFLYRQWKGVNPQLTREEGDIGFFLRILDSLDASGLGMNPFLRKTVELARVMPRETWRSVFPQTDLVEVLSRTWWERRFPDGINMETWLADPLLELVGLESVSDFKERKLEEAIGFEMAGQAQRGEKVSRDAALRKVQDYMAAQVVVGYLTGVYARHMDEADIALYKALEIKMAEGYAYDPALYVDNPGLRIFGEVLKARKAGLLDTIALEKWAMFQQVYDAYLQVPLNRRDEFLMENPEVLAYIRAASDVVAPLSQQVQRLKLQAETSRILPLLEKLWTLDLSLSYDEQNELYETVVSPELREYWAANDTSYETQERTVKGILRQHIDEMQSAYFAIPADDYDAQDEFLAQNPLLSWYWQHKDQSTGSLAEKLYKAANAQLRSLWAAMMNSGNIDAANDFLEQFPFIMEFTASQDNILPSGQWIPKKLREDSRFRKTWEEWAMRNPFEAAATDFWTEFYRLPPGPEREKLVRDFGIRYGFEPYTQSYGAQLQKDVLARILQRQGSGRGYNKTNQWAYYYKVLKPLIDAFWALPPDRRAAYLEAHPAVAEYFNRYAARHAWTKKGITYLQNRYQLEAFWGLSGAGNQAAYLAKNVNTLKYLMRFADEEVQAQVDAWRSVSGSLEGISDLPPMKQVEVLAQPEVLAYLRDWGILMPPVRDFMSVYADWKLYWTVPEAERAGWLQQRPALAEWMRENGKEAPQQAWEYMAVQPLLMELWELEGVEAEIYLQQHPELMSYFDRWVFSGPDFGPRQHAYQLVAEAIAGIDVDGDVAGYLGKHPEILTYWSTWGKQYSQPEDGKVAEALSYDFVNEYFAIKDEAERTVYLDTHPELKLFFQKHGDLKVGGALERLLREYFEIPRYSNERDRLLKANPILQQYFYDKADPEEQAVMDLLDVYFALRDKDSKDWFLAAHPEVEIWLQERRETKKKVRDLRYQYDRGQPLMASLYEDYAKIFLPEAERVRRMLAAKNTSVELLRRDPSKKGRVSDMAFGLS